MGKSVIFWVFCWPYRNFMNLGYKRRPKASDVLAAYIRKRNYPSWTSYFVAYKEIQDDNFGEKHFNFQVDGRNYHILRTGCFPYIKYHCTQRSYQDLSAENNLYRVITAVNLGIPCLLYGIAAIGLIRHCDSILEPRTNKAVTINFLIEEDHQSVKMMGPDDPFNYKPTAEFMFIILFVVFPLIYLCGKLVTYLLWQVLRCMRYLLVSLYEFYYADEFEEARQVERERRKRRHDLKRKTLRLEKAVRELSEVSKSNGGPPVTQNGTSRVDESISTELTDLQIETEEDKKEDEPMHHSPTDDEEEVDVLDASKTSKESSLGSDNPKLKHKNSSYLKSNKELPKDAVINNPVAT
ncbi:hypothetical protein FO519_001534 [Halicephalobus sp. NKZ332]|nr:hypothetical protein FO519_001534 [Halicephalobus sp. NKZ332]